MLRSICLLLAAGLCPSLWGADWTQFRGPTGDGVARDARPPVVWSETENVAWKVEVPGRGWSSPVSDGQFVWLTSAIEETLGVEEMELLKKAKFSGNPMANEMSLLGAVSLRLIKLDASTGREIQNLQLFRVQLPDGVHTLNSYASPSPVLVDGQIVCHFGTMGTALVAADSGEIFWKTRLPLDHRVGPGSSPVVWNSLVILHCDGADDQSVVALDLKTGNEVWRTKRPPMIGNDGDLHKAFSTPLIVHVDEKPQVLSVGAQWVVSYEPATGQEIWRLHHGVGFSNVPRPVVKDGVAVICTGYTRPTVMAIRLGGHGELGKSDVLWQTARQAPAMPSPVLFDDAVCFVSDQGVATCVSAATGKEIWQRRIGGNYSASPLLAGGKIYISNREGLTTVFKATKTFEEVAQNTLEGQIMASPALIGNDLILRSATHLYRISDRPVTAP